MTESSNPPPWRDHAEGVALFLFIPLVLFLYVSRPEPMLVSLVAGLVLMFGHRLIARPYMQKVAPRLCLWTHRRLDAGHGEALETASIELHARAGVQEARCLAKHAQDVARFFTWIHKVRVVIAIGIFIPLALMLIAALVAATGRSMMSLDLATAIFQLSVGITVNVASLGYLTVRQVDEPLRVPVPAHNFFLLGIRTLLWIFRIVGVLWIARGLQYFL